MTQPGAALAPDHVIRDPQQPRQDQTVRVRNDTVSLPPSLKEDQGDGILSALPRARPTEHVVIDRARVPPEQDPKGRAIPAAYPLPQGRIRDTVRQIILPIWNSWYFLSLYANAAGTSGKFRTDSADVLAANGASYDTALRIEEEAQRIAGNSADCREAVSAFLEKRAPVFRGE